MFRGKTSSKIAFFVSLIFICFLHIYSFLNSLYAGKYHEEFINDQFDKIELKIYNVYTDLEIKIKITNNKDIDLFYKIFSKNLDNFKHEKEAKLYDYSIWLKFYNIDGTNVYKYKVFFDNEKLLSRPVFLYKKGRNNELDGYPFQLNDLEYKFYNEIIKLIE